MRYRGIYICGHMTPIKEEKKEEEREKKKEEIDSSTIESMSLDFFDLSAHAKAMRELEKMLDASDASGDSDGSDDSGGSGDDDNSFYGGCFDDDDDEDETFHSETKVEK